MDKHKKYRVSEYLGYYTVEVLKIKTKGYLWWKKKYTQWEICNILGGAFFISLYLTPPPFLLCETREEAKKKMNEFILRDLTKN